MISIWLVFWQNIMMNWTWNNHCQHIIHKVNIMLLTLNCLVCLWMFVIKCWFIQYSFYKSFILSNNEWKNHTILFNNTFTAWIYIFILSIVTYDGKLNKCFSCLLVNHTIHLLSIIYRQLWKQWQRVHVENIDLQAEIMLKRNLLQILCEIKIMKFKIEI